MNPLRWVLDRILPAPPISREEFSDEVTKLRHATVEASLRNEDAGLRCDRRTEKVLGEVADMIAGHHDD